MTAKTYSDYIKDLTRVAENNGFSVVLAFTNEFSGRIDYTKKTISISEPSAESAMLTLIHEMGHMLHYFRSPNFVDSSSQSYETQAYLYGWAVITKFSLPVSRQVWRQYNRICSNSADALEKMNMSNDQKTAVVSPTCADLASYWKAAHDGVVAQNCELSRQADALREAAGAVTKGFSALETLLAAQDADIPDTAPLWVKVSGQHEEVGTYGQLRALRRALNLAHPQQGGERDGWKLPKDLRALSDEAGVTFDSSSMIESVPQHGGGGALLGWHFSDQDEGTRKLSALIKLALRVRTLLGAAPTSASKSSGEEA